MKAFVRDEGGQTAIEYGLIIAMIFLVIVTSVTAFGNRTAQIMQQNAAAIAAAGK